MSPPESQAAVADGRARWLPASELRALYRVGMSYDAIAEVNERSTGWKPSRSGVMRKLRRIGVERRLASHRDLIPWRIAPEHEHQRLHYMLMAESRRRQGRRLSRSDRTLVSLLKDLLSGRGVPLVVNYDRRFGFFLIESQDFDLDIIRSPGQDTEDIAEE